MGLGTELSHMSNMKVLNISVEILIFGQQDTDWFRLHTVYLEITVIVFYLPLSLKHMNCVNIGIIYQLFKKLNKNNFGLFKDIVCGEWFNFASVDLYHFCNKHLELSDQVHTNSYKVL
jgi:hypothetical protein